MGKSKRKKMGAVGDGAAGNPTGLPSVKDALEEAESSGLWSDDFVSAHIEKLSSASAEERECACVALGSCSSNASLLAKDTVRQLGALLLDRSVGVARAACGLLRNISVDGGYSACDAMIAHDVMTPLLVLLKQFLGDGWRVSKPVDGKADAYTETFVNASQLVQNLCESSNAALKVASLESIAELLVQRLNPAEYGGEVSIAAAECLLVLTEDNLALRSSLQAAEPARHLSEAAIAGLDFVDSAPAESSAGDMLHAAVAIAGVLVNICGSNLTALGAAMAPRLLKLLLDVVNVDAVGRLQQLYETASCTLQTLQPSEDDAPAAVPHEDALRLQESTTTHLLAAQKLALEILTGVLSTDGNEDEWDDVETTSECSDIGSDFNGQTGDGLDGEVELEGLLSSQAACMPSELMDFLVQNGLLHKVTSCIRILPDDLSSKLAECETLDGVQVVHRYEATMCAALLCLHNALLATASAEQIGGAEAISRIWGELSSLSGQPHVLQSPPLVEAVTTALGSTAERMLEGSAGDKLLAVTEQDLSMLGALACGSSQPQVRANAVHIVSMIGRKLAAQPTSTSDAAPSRSLLLCIGTLLLKVASTDVELWVNAEALDALMDVFAEDHVDGILKELHLIDALEQMAPALKTQIKQNRKRLLDHLPVITTVQNNLGRFISYKRKRGV